MKNEIIERCYKKSVELLIKNSTDFGILASSPSGRAVKRSYLSIFGRDASICALGMIASGNRELIKIAKKSLVTLAKHQTEFGQMPNYVKPKENQVDFWRTDCVDSNLWWLLVLKFYDWFSGDKRLLKSLNKKIDKAIFWLSCQEHPKSHLLVQNEASDWADLMPRSGKVLYSNALWAKVKTLYKVKDFKKTKDFFNGLLHPFSSGFKNVNRRSQNTIELIRKKMKPTNYYLSFINFKFWGEDIDVYGNSLAILFGLADKKLEERIVKFLTKKRKLKNMPMPVLFNPIKENSKSWREYMKDHSQNYPYQYHNGGIWPYTACFWAMALARAGHKRQAWQEMERIAQANSINNWQFNEWFYGRTGKPMGMAGQSWNAGAFLLAYHYLKGEVKI